MDDGQMMVLATQQRNSPHFYHICCNLSVWMMFLAEHQRCSPHLMKYLLQRCSWQRGKRKWSDSIQSLPLPLTTITVRGNRLRFVRYLTKWDKIYNTHSKVRPWLIFFKWAIFLCWWKLNWLQKIELFLDIQSLMKIKILFDKNSIPCPLDNLFHPHIAPYISCLIRINKSLFDRKQRVQSDL